MIFSSKLKTILLQLRERMNPGINSQTTVNVAIACASLVYKTRYNPINNCDYYLIIFVKSLKYRVINREQMITQSRDLYQLGGKTLEKEFECRQRRT